MVASALRRRTWAAKKLANIVTSPMPSRTTPTEKLDPRRLWLAPSASTSPMAFVAADSSRCWALSAGTPPSSVGANDGPWAGASAEGASASAVAPGAGAAPVAVGGAPAGRAACGARVGELLAADGPAGAVATAGAATGEAVLPDDVVPVLGAAVCTGVGAAFEVVPCDCGGVGAASPVGVGVGFWVCVDGSDEGPVDDVPPEGGGAVAGAVTLYVTDDEPTTSPLGSRSTALMKYRPGGASGIFTRTEKLGPATLANGVSEFHTTWTGPVL